MIYIGSMVYYIVGIYRYTRRSHGLTKYIIYIIHILLLLLYESSRIIYILYRTVAVPAALYNWENPRK